MKIIFLFLLVNILLIDGLRAQTFKHFDIMEKDELGVVLKHKSDTLIQNLIREPNRIGDEFINETGSFLREAVDSIIVELPSGIKKVLQKQRIFLFVTYDATGTILALRIKILMGKNNLLFTEKQILRIYNDLRSLIIPNSQKVEFDMCGIVYMFPPHNAKIYQTIEN